MALKASGNVLGLVGEGANLAGGLSGNCNRQGSAPVGIGCPSSEGGGIPSSLIGFSCVPDELLDVYVGSAKSLDYERHKLIPMVRTECVLLAFLLFDSVVGSMKTRFSRAGNKFHLAAIHDSDVHNGLVIKDV